MSCGNYIMPSIIAQITDYPTPITESGFKAALKQFRHNFVLAFNTKLIINQVLGGPTPLTISHEECGLPRSVRRTLAQLRSGLRQSPILMAYQNRLDESQSPLCPSCSVEVHTSSHLFSCVCHPTSLSPLSLWDDPLRAASFLCTEWDVSLGVTIPGFT